MYVCSDTVATFNLFEHCHQHISHSILLPYYLPLTHALGCRLSFSSPLNGGRLCDGSESLNIEVGLVLDKGLNRTGSVHFLPLESQSLCNTCIFPETTMLWDSQAKHADPDGRETVQKAGTEQAEQMTEGTYREEPLGSHMDHRLNPLAYLFPNF